MNLVNILVRFLLFFISLGFCCAFLQSNLINISKIKNKNSPQNHQSDFTTTNAPHYQNLPHSSELHATPSDFEPSALDPQVIYGQLAVIFATFGATLYWWKVTVPDRRKDLAMAKRSGPLKEYLKELREEDLKVEGKLSEGNRSFERWLLSNWVRDNGQKPKRDPSETPRFNSGDNPVLAAGILIVLTGVVNAIFEQATGRLSSLW